MPALSLAPRGVHDGLASRSLEVCSQCVSFTDVAPQAALAGPCDMDELMASLEDAAVGTAVESVPIMLRKSILESVRDRVLPYFYAFLRCEVLTPA